MDTLHIIQLIQEVARAHDVCVDTVLAHVHHTAADLPTPEHLRPYEHMTIRELKTRVFLRGGICMKEGTKLEHMWVYYKLLQRPAAPEHRIKELLGHLSMRHLLSLCADLHMGVSLPRTQQGLIREILLER